MYVPLNSPMLLGLGCAALALLGGCSLIQDFDSVQRNEISAGGASGDGGSSSGSSGSSSGSAGDDSGEQGGGGGSGGSASNMGGSEVTEDPPDAGMDAAVVQTEPGLVNGSFEQGYLGWSAEPPELLGLYAFVQWPPQGSTTPDGLNEISTWAESTSFSVRIFQAMTGLADGTYTFKGHFNFGTGHDAVRIFHRSCGGTDVETDIPQTAASQWQETELPNIQVVGGSCQVGFFVDANAGNWLNADQFTFELVPE